MMIRSSQHITHKAYHTSIVIRGLVMLGMVAIGIQHSPTADAQYANAQPAVPGGVQNGLFLHGGDTYRVVDTAGYRTMADIGASEPGSIAQVGLGGCRSCGTSSCDGGCDSIQSTCSGGCGGSCGGGCGNGYGNGNGNGNGYGGGYGGSCSNCGGGGRSYLGGPCGCSDPYCYVSVEGVYMRHDRDRYSLTRNFGIGQFDYELAPRITIGSVPDCVHGWEMGFVGPLEWDRSRSISSPGGGINSNLDPQPPLTLADISSFNDATFQSHFHESRFWSLEASRTTFAGEYAKLLYGGRYINYEELFIFNSTSAAGPGSLRADVENQLFGFQVGMDLLYPICCNGYTDMRFRLGGYYNRADAAVSLINAGALSGIGGADASKLAGVFEYGVGVRYQLGELLSVRAGGELWYLSRFATGPGQIGRRVRERIGLGANINQDFLLTGISVGAELKY